MTAMRQRIKGLPPDDPWRERGENDVSRIQSAAEMVRRLDHRNDFRCANIDDVVKNARVEVLREIVILTLLPILLRGSRSRLRVRPRGGGIRKVTSFFLLFFLFRSGGEKD